MWSRGVEASIAVELVNPSAVPGDGANKQVLSEWNPIFGVVSLPQSGLILVAGAVGGVVHNLYAFHLSKADGRMDPVYELRH